jgi:hypothetical protein
MDFSHLSRVSDQMESALRLAVNSGDNRSVERGVSGRSIAG